LSYSRTLLNHLILFGQLKML